MSVSQEMETTRLMRRGALAALLGGSLLPIYQLLHPARDAQTVLGTPYALIHALGIIALVHLLFGLVTIYLRQQDRAGPLGTNAFILAFFGTALWVGALFLDAFLNPVLATYASETQTEGHGANALQVFGPMLGPVGLLVPAASLLFVGGTILFAIVTMRARVFPQLPALLVIPVVALFGAGVFVPVWIETIGGILLGAGYAVMGYKLWQEPTGDGLSATHRTL